ncbi:MAG: cbb3-type cytochrome c oxidase subunit I [Simkaniaceae bacterium]
MQKDEEKSTVSRWWLYTTLIVMAFGFVVLGFITKLAYENVPPVPEKVIDEKGKMIFTKEQILGGQKLFFQKDLMEHGTLWGHGAYLGPDYSAEYLHQEALLVRECIAKEQNLGSNKETEKQTIIADKVPEILKKNGYNPQTGILVFPNERACAFDKALQYWKDYFSLGEAPGLPKSYITDPQDIFDLTAFFAWSAWAASANREGKDYSYTNNFPYDPLAGNHPSTDAYFWSAISLVVLLIGIGLLLFLFGKYDFLGWGSRRNAPHQHVSRLEAIRLTPSQKATAKFLIVIGILFLLQSFVGGALAHYRIEKDFYGFPLADYLPFNLLRTWHLQLAIFWIATAWIAGGLFLAPLFHRVEPKYQKAGVNILFSALLIVVFGSLLGEFFSAHGYMGSFWFWFGNQGSEYLDLGRAWQILLLAGFVVWLFLIFRVLYPAFKASKGDKKELVFLFFIASAAIPVFYIPALFYNAETNYTIIDNWRFWIIHLWVEGFFEVFTTVLVASIFVLMGLVRTGIAVRLIYLDAILYLGAGVIGTGHHWYFTGQTTPNMALSALFSGLEIVPLTILTLDAWNFIQISRAKCSECAKYMQKGLIWTFYFLVAVGLWNFVGAGLFGFLINLPIISYFEVGTNLTPNHGHAAMFGVFGMLALGIAVFAMRSLLKDKEWDRLQKWVKFGFWGLNLGLALMIFLELFPSGLLQLWDAMKNGYWHARRLTYLMSNPFHFFERIRIVADSAFLLIGVIPISIAFLLAYVFLFRRESSFLRKK